MRVRVTLRQDTRTRLERLMKFVVRGMMLAMILLPELMMQGQELSSSRVTANEAAAESSSSGLGTAAETALDRGTARLPFEYGVLGQGGFGLTEERSGFKFAMVGVHAGKVLYRNGATGIKAGNFEYAMELFPYWQSFTPKFQKASCVAVNTAVTDGEITCSPYYTVGGTFSGITVTPIILRWNFAGGRVGGGRIKPWAQAAGGLLWTNHKYPAFGSSVLNLQNDGPNSDASVWNFTPQGGIGLHYFVTPDRSIDFGANAVHISSASLGDRNPGVNASVQLSVGYSFWK